MSGLTFLIFICYSALGLVVFDPFFSELYLCGAMLEKRPDSLSVWMLCPPLEVIPPDM